MADDKTTGLYQFTAPVVMSFPNVITARAFERNGKAKGEPKYDASFVFPPDHPDLAGIKAKAVALAKAKWPGMDIKAKLASGDFKLPWGDGTKMADKRNAKRKDKGQEADTLGDFQRGKTVLKTSSKYQPQLAALLNGKIVTFEDEASIKANAGKFYFGVEVLAEINLQAYDAVGDDGKPGVTAYLNQVLSLNKGTKIAGSKRSAAETFKGYVGSVKAEDPTSDNLSDLVDDDIPF